MWYFRNNVGVGVFLAVLGFAFSTQQGFARGDKYFTKTDSDANVYVSPFASDIDRVAILPFKAPTELVGTSVSDLFVTEMLRAGRYTLLERSQMAKVLSESELALSGLSAAQAVEVGQMIGADGVIIGTVIEYGTTAYKGHAYPVVSVSVRLIDTKSSQVVWSVDLAVRADSKKTSLSGQARIVVHEMMAGLYKQWQTQKSNPNPRSRTAKKSSGAYKKDPDLYQPVGYSGDPAVAPEVPRGFSVSDFGLREVILRWESPVDAPYQYQIERATSEGGPFEALDRTSPRKKKFVDRGSRSDPLEDNSAYYYRLLAVSQNGVKSDPTDALESMTAPPPDPPGEVRVNAPSSRCIEVEWEPSESEGVATYRLERALVTEPVEYQFLTETKRTAYKDGGTSRTDLKDSTVYMYRIQAVNRVKSVGPFSSPADVTTLPLPHAVESVAAESGEVRCVPLSWESHSDLDIISYTIYRCDTQDGEYSELVKLKGSSHNSYLDGRKNPGSLQDDTDYFYVILAKNDVGAESPDSKIIAARTRPAPPAIIGFEGGSDVPREVPLNWEQSDDEKVTGYEIWRLDPDAADYVKIADISSPETTQYVDRGPRSRATDSLGRLEDGAEYHYKMKAFNAAYALSDWSREIGLKTKDAPATPALHDPSTTEPHQVTLVWQATPEDDISAYELQSSSDATRRFKTLGSVDAENASTFEFIDDQLNSGTVRYYRLRTIDEASLTSLWSEVVSGQAKPVPDAPEDLAADYGMGTADLTWVAPETEDVVEYRIWKKSGFTKWRAVDTTTDKAYSFTAEALGKKGTFSVTSIDKDDLESDRSTSVSLQAKLILAAEVEDEAIVSSSDIADVDTPGNDDANELMQ